MLFGVRDEILDVMRSSERVRRRILIYRKSCFGHRKSFGLIGSVPGVPGECRGTIARGVTTPGPHGLWEDVYQPLVGWPSLSQGPKAPRRWKARVLEREGEESY